MSVIPLGSQKMGILRKIIHEFANGEPDIAAVVFRSRKTGEWYESWAWSDEARDEKHTVYLAIGALESLKHSIFAWCETAEVSVFEDADD